jgi:hypothetical protein
MRQVRCELCGRSWCFSNDEQCKRFFIEHLKTHSREEVEALHKLAKLELQNKEAYEELSFQLGMLGRKGERRNE